MEGEGPTLWKYCSDGEGANRLASGRGAGLGGEARGKDPGFLLDKFWE